MSASGKKSRIIRPEELNLAVDGLFTAVVSGDDGGAALDALAQAMNAASCFFYPKDGAALLTQLPNSEVMRPILTKFVADGWYLQDLRAQRGWPLAATGRKVLLEQDISTEEERRRLPIYQEFLRNHRMTWWAGVLCDANDQNWCMAIPRFDDQGAFSREEARVLSLLGPRISQLIGLAENLGEARASGALDAVTRLRTPALLVDRFRRRLRTNEQAERLFDQDFHLSGGRLRAKDGASDSLLQKLLASACAAQAADRRSSTLEPVVVARFPRRPLLVEALPIRAGFADAFSGAAALVTITDIASRPRPSAKLLSAAFALTPAEARLAVSLVGGATLDLAAEAVQITRETARTRLKAIFAKTGTGRQTELVALLSRLPSAASD
jgi:DNA-binding CsgD family transcriptional regulator